MMSAVGKDKSWRHFRSCKALMKFFAEENVMTRMSEDRKKKFYALIYAGTLRNQTEHAPDQPGTDPDALDQSDFDIDDVYSSVMESVGEKATLRHFERNKPMLKIVSSRGVRECYFAKKSEDEKKELYKGVYQCFLFNK